MNSVNMEHVLNEIINSMHMNFGLKVIETHVINQGWLNVKWRFLTDKGPLFVKYYHPNRYMVRSVKMVYIIESNWWLRTEMLENHAVLKRFMEEMVWLTTHWKDLPAIFME